MGRRWSNLATTPLFPRWCSCARSHGVRLPLRFLLLPNTTIFRGGHPYRGRTPPGHQFRNQMLGVPDRPPTSQTWRSSAPESPWAVDRRSGVEGIRCSTDAVNRWCALISGLICGWLRSVHPKFGRIPTSTVWFMNSVGLNIFIAIVGISAGPGFIKRSADAGHQPCSCGEWWPRPCH